MTRKRFIKLMRATMVECYAINKRNGGCPTTAKQVEDSLRNFRLAEGKTYAESWSAINTALRGIVSTCK